MFFRNILIVAAISSVLTVGACSGSVDQSTDDAPTAQLPPADQATPEPTPKPTFAIPDLQAELTDATDAQTDSPIGSFDFKNYTYELPRGWQNPDGTSDITLRNGRLAPIETNVNEKMDDMEKAEAKQERRIGMTYVATKFFDITGDGQDEAVVVLKIETGGSAVPQIAYVFTWKEGKPELIWPFRTGDRSDGGLKNVWAEDGLFAVELYGQDRYLLGQTETGKIGDDIEQLCCPTHFTRSFYKWNGKNFTLQGKRLTYLTADPSAPPAENLVDKVNQKQPQKSK